MLVFPGFKAFLVASIAFAKNLPQVKRSIVSLPMRTPGTTSCLVVAMILATELRMMYSKITVAGFG